MIKRLVFNFRTSELYVYVSWICQPRECVSIDLKNFKSLHLSQFLDLVKFDQNQDQDTIW